MAEINDEIKNSHAALALRRVKGGRLSRIQVQLCMRKCKSRFHQELADQPRLAEEEKKKKERKKEKKLGSVRGTVHVPSECSQSGRGGDGSRRRASRMPRLKKPRGVRYINDVTSKVPLYLVVAMPSVIAASPAPRHGLVSRLSPYFSRATSRLASGISRNIYYLIYAGASILHAHLSSVCFFLGGGFRFFSFSFSFFSFFFSFAVLLCCPRRPKKKPPKPIYRCT